MIPIQQLFSRIRWDPDFAKAEFKIGYYDRMEHEILIVPFEQLEFSAEDHFTVKISDNLGVVHMVPLHRVKQVYRNNELIWQRTH